MEKQAGLYELRWGEVPPFNAAVLWNDTIHSDQQIPHLMSKAADLTASPVDVARFSGMAGAVARLERDGRGWVISRRTG